MSPVCDEKEVANLRSELFQAQDEAEKLRKRLRDQDLELQDSNQRVERLSKELSRERSTFQTQMLLSDQRWQMRVDNCVTMRVQLEKELNDRKLMEDEWQRQIHDWEMRREQLERELNEIKRSLWFQEGGDIAKLKAQLQVEFNDSGLLTSKAPGCEVIA